VEGERCVGELNEGENESVDIAMLKNAWRGAGGDNHGFIAVELGAINVRRHTGGESMDISVSLLEKVKAQYAFFTPASSCTCACTSVLVFMHARMHACTHTGMQICLV